MKRKNETSRVFTSPKMRQIILIIAALASCLAFPTKHSNLRIYGGKTAKPGQFPFAVAINVTANGTAEMCAGSIIHESWIVTTATCSELYGFKADELVVISGTNQLDTETGVVYNVNQIVLHPNFTIENLQEANIALFQIDGSFTFSDLVQPITLGDVSVDDTVTVAGWGHTQTLQNPALQYAELTAWSNQDCTNAIDGAGEIHPGEVCAFGGEGVGICIGDIGAPLVHDGTLVGLGSWAMKACGRGKPDVYTRVSYYKDWINDVIKS